ncbi:uncharacterized protein AMSG_06849 [Thecamonas trahens ATCC 50062]|uniref:Uncharacterized protein n=1 Tax=Thecamonas trahens ATCC 50062 TaxID=461836 RepID=A0A0L0DDD2_THETB|nr:hypothetical protein AMSG_06849 [Thecamonas trahens ATCC 50062]KNC50362.1 hypothetical protein AMSG_06849 [Thecamonas trahens ATCC 50062]|eukprot:XP_013756904.1 hypothetical protein AMSG_06849 [Thecamonas trahens ATCC 50062]
MSVASWATGLVVGFAIGSYGASAHLDATRKQMLTLSSLTTDLTTANRVAAGELPLEALSTSSVSASASPSSSATHELIQAEAPRHLASEHLKSSWNALISSVVDTSLPLTSESGRNAAISNLVSRFN